MKWIVALAVLLSGCAIPESAKQTLVFGHGGMGADNEWPMDSEHSIDQCLALGADGVELDVHMTPDSVLVAYHDEDLSTRTSCSGRVNAKRWEELASCSYGEVEFTKNGETFLGITRLVSLDPILVGTPGSATARFTLACKLFAVGEWDAYLNAYVTALDSLVQRHHLQGRVNVECMDAGFLVRVKNAVPGAAVFYYAIDAEAGIALAHEHGFAGITIDHKLITAEQVKTARTSGLKVALFGTGGDWSHRQALALGAEMIQTDDVAGLLHLLGR
mgnify:CR=1 FL=1